MSQEPTLFATTIAENIRFGKPGECHTHASDLDLPCLQLPRQLQLDLRALQAADLRWRCSVCLHTSTCRLAFYGRLCALVDPSGAWTKGHMVSMAHLHWRCFT